MCEITHGGLQFYASVTDVRQTAVDLVTCAAYSEMMMELVKLGLPAKQVSAFTTAILERDKPFGSPTTFELWPAGLSTKRGQPVVLIGRAGVTGPGDPLPQDAVYPDEAREMALAWFEAAEATESDQKVTAALRLIRQEKIAECLFATLRKLRADP
jgi:hypothetical protein